MDSELTNCSELHVCFCRCVFLVSFIGTLFKLLYAKPLQNIYQRITMNKCREIRTIPSCQHFIAKVCFWYTLAESSSAPRSKTSSLCNAFRTTQWWLIALDLIRVTLGGERAKVNFITVTGWIISRKTFQPSYVVIEYRRYLLQVSHKLQISGGFPGSLSLCTAVTNH